MADYQSIVMQMQYWLISQIENVHPNSGDPAEMTPEYAAGRNAAFSAAQEALLSLIEGQSPTFPGYMR